MKIGDWVVYYDGNKTPELGRIKSFSVNSRDNVFVVYHCGGDWENYKNYTGASSDVECLTVISYEEKK